MNARTPPFWLYETTGVLRPAVEAYLKGKQMTPFGIAALRAYLRVWIMSPVWIGDDVDLLRRDLEGLTSVPAIDAWIRKAIDLGIDPL